MCALSFEKFTHQAEPFAQGLLDAVYAMSKDPVAGVSRQGYSALETKVLACLTDRVAALKLEVEQDPAGNVWLTLPGRNRSMPAIVSGSHVDSVPQGGHYDGLAGVVAALTVAKILRDEGVTLERDYRVLMLRSEESSFFGKAYAGSLAMMGRLTAEGLALKHRSENRTLGDFMRAAGVDTEKVTSGSPLVDISRIGSFIELHIEQGPMLDGLLPARTGVVTGIRGNIRHKCVRCLGETAHSGAVNKEFRHDAVMATAALISRCEEQWQRYLDAGKDLVFTVGVLNTSPSAAIAVIPGQTAFSVDIRSLDDETCREFHEMLLGIAAEEEARRGVKFEFDSVIGSPAGRVNEALSDLVFKAAQDAGVPCVRIPSGAGHDTAVLSRAGIASAMIFIANQHGSHNPHEAMEMKDLMLGTYVLLNAVRAQG